MARQAEYCKIYTVHGIQHLVKTGPCSKLIGTPRLVPPPVVTVGAPRRRAVAVRDLATEHGSASMDLQVRSLRCLLVAPCPHSCIERGGLLSSAAGGQWRMLLVVAGGNGC